MFRRIKDVPSDEELRDAFAGEIVKIFVKYICYIYVIYLVIFGWYTVMD